MDERDVLIGGQRERERECLRESVREREGKEIEKVKLLPPPPSLSLLSGPYFI